MTIIGDNPGMLSRLLADVEAHASLTQAVAAIVSTSIATVALYYAVRSLKALQRQTDASVATLTETFRPIVEVLGGFLREKPAYTEVEFENKGNGAALNFRWRVDEEPERWGGHTTNIIAPHEKGQLKAPMAWQKGLVLSYNSVSHREEIRTYVTFGPIGSVTNQHDVRQGAAVTRMGWTVLDPKFAVPGYHPDFIAVQPLGARIMHWWRLKRGSERRL